MLITFYNNCHSNWLFDDNIKEVKKITSDKSYILEPSYRKLVEFTLNEINNQSYFYVRSITKWYMFNVLKLPRYKNGGTLLQGIIIKVTRIVQELVRLNIVIKDGKLRYKNLFRGNIRNALDEQINKNYFTITSK